MKKMKRILSLVTAAVMVFSVMVLPVNAATPMTASEFLALEQDGVITLTEDVTLSEKVIINKDLTIKGEGFKVSGNDKKVFEVVNATNDEMTVVFESVKIENTAHQGRCIDTRNDYIDLQVKDCTLTASGTNSQPLTIGGTDEDDIVYVTLENTKINAGKTGYGLISFVQIESDISNSEIKGYSAIYLKENAAYSVVRVDNSELVGTNPCENYVASNDFGTIVIECDEILINLEKSVVKALASDEGNLQSVLVLGKTNGEMIEYTFVNISEHSEIITSGNAAFAVDKNNSSDSLKNSTNEIVVYEDVKTTIDIEEEFLEEGKKVENGVVTCKHAVTINVDKVEPTCTENGYEARTICRDCRKTVSQLTVIPATGVHDYKNGQCTMCEKLEDVTTTPDNDKDNSNDNVQDDSNKDDVTIKDETNNDETSKDESKNEGEVDKDTTNDKDSSDKAEGETEKPVKTGDKTIILPLFASLVLSAGAIVFLNKKKIFNQ